MTKKTMLRIFGGLIILFNLWLIGEYSIQGVPVLLMTFGVAFAFEWLLIKNLKDS